MDVRNCRKCGKMFNYISGLPICPSCKEAAEAVFQKVKKFVSDNKSATIDEICAECEVDPQQVRQWVREERLFFADDSPVKISCEICGAQIPSGRYCDACKKNTAQTFGNTYKSSMPKLEKPAPSSSSSGIKMYTFNK